MKKMYEVSLRTMMLVSSLMIAASAQAALVGEWTFDAQSFVNSGTAGSTHDGMFVTSNTGYFSADTAGGSGYSLRIKSISDDDSTGGGDVLLINNSKTTDAGYLSTFDGAAFTVSMWIKTEDVNWRQWDEIAGKQIENYGGSPNDGWSLRSRGTTMRFDSYGDATAESAPDPLNQSWHLITATYDGIAGDMKLYIDGTLEAAKSTASISDASLHALAFGARNDGSRGENVLIDDIQFYDNELSAPEVSALYYAPVQSTYALVLDPPNGHRIPKVLGGSGDTAMLTGYDYFDWWGITEYRAWFKPTFSSLADDSGITSAAAFESASETIRQDPTRQATPSDYYIDWDHFYDEVDNNEMPKQLQYLKERGITAMITSSRDISDNTSITGDWPTMFAYWKYWYAMVYHFASEYDVTLYQYRNEPHAWIDYATWESHWLVAVDAMRKAIDDVNADFGKSLEPNFCGPVCPGVYWDYSITEPYSKSVEGSDPHGWGSLSWTKVKYDIYGNYDVNNPWNYNSYDYHRYGDAAGGENIMLNARIDIANAQNNPSSDIPLIISEYNTNTGGTFDRKELDTEDLQYGITMAQILHASAAHGPDGLGDDGGIFIFKLGSSEDDAMRMGTGNKLSHASRHGPENYGGVTRGGACFQMYASHFNGGKPLVPVSVTSGANDARRTLAAIDEEKAMVYIYGSNCSGSGVPVSIDLSALDVAAGAVASLQRVDEKNTGQVTELLSLDGSKRIEFYAPDYTAYMIKVPMTGTAPYRWELAPSEDTTQRVSDSGNQGASATMNVSTHHSDAAQRNVGLLRFSVGGAGNMGQALLKLSGRNTGTDQVEREILHVYAVTGEDWSEDASMAWANAPGLGQYHVDENTMGTTDGTGDMIDIEDNYGGYSSGSGTGLGLTGKFLGAVSFHSSDYEDNYLDVSDYLNSVDHDGSAPLDVTFVVARIVRYNVNEYSNSYYNVGDYHYDGRVIEIATKEHADAALQPRLICSSGLPPVIEAEDFANSSGVSVLPSSDVDGGDMVEFSAAGNSVSYEVRVSRAGTYLVGFRVASASGLVKLELAQDGMPLTTLNRLIDAGETWTTVYKMVSLQAGFTSLTVSATDGGTQLLNWINIASSDGVFEESIPVDPTNLALNQPASASNVHSSGYPAAKAVDGDLGTRWATSVLTPWMEVDLGEAVLINGSRIVEDRNRIRSYEIQVYNGSWETVFVGGNPSSDQTEQFDSVMGSKARLQITAATDNPTIEEWELYGASAFNQSSTMALNDDSISLEWSNVPGATYAVHSSTNLVTDAFSATIESGIPALTTTNSITIEMPVDPSAFYRVIAE